MSHGFNRVCIRSNAGGDNVDQSKTETIERWAWCGVQVALTAMAIAMLVACGGSKDDSSDAREQELNYPAPTGANAPTSREAAARFLTQASFGPTDASVQRVMDIGYSQWIDDQFTKSVSRHRANWEAMDGYVKAGASATPTSTIGQDGLLHSFWRSAVSGEDQLRQRVAFALSEIFVISMLDNNVGESPRGAADYYEQLSTVGLSTYRELIETVSMHPMMGRYLTSLANRKADAATGRVPDENYAREVMQLFSVGLWELNLDGTQKLAGGAPIETYAPADIAGLAKVFTGWSWACPVAPTLTNSTCFGSGNGTYNGQSDPDRMFKSMIAYPQQHSVEEKRFLGVTVASQTTGTNPVRGTPDPATSLRTALDRLATHPNTAPFISKQLIQRLVTSNPSPAYVASVAGVFNTTGGDMKAVVKAILLHNEARTMSANAGKVREPILKLSAALRAFGFTSDSGWYKVGNTDNPSTQLGQTVLRAPSVFNFYRPGYVPPGSQAAAANLVSPEMQISHETTAAGYVNYVRDTVSGGVGQSNAAPYNRRDLQPNFTAELALAERPAELVAQVDKKLTYGTMPAALKVLIQNAVGSITLPTVGASGATQAQLDAAKRNRVNAAVFLALVSPEYQVQK
jgi:uncharacterized protein (DUF1800 family)